MIKIFKIVTALILLTPAQALPSNNLNRLKSADSENQFQYFYPSSVVVKNDLSSSLTGEVKSPIELRGIAKEYMMNALEITDESRFKITSGLQDSQGTFKYQCKPVINGIPVENAQATVVVNKFGQVSSLAHSWTVKAPLVKRALGNSVSPLEALNAFCKVKNFDCAGTSIAQDGKSITGAKFTTSDIKFSTVNYRTANGVVESFSLMVPMKGDYFNAMVSKEGEVLSITNFASHSVFQSKEMLGRRDRVKSSKADPYQPKKNEKRKNRLKKRGITASEYLVAPLPKTDFSQGTQSVQNPEDLTVSPDGWHNINGTKEEGISIGNNVVAQADGTNTLFKLKKKPPPQVFAESGNFKFDFKIDDKKQVPPQYAPGSVTNMFVLTNEVHDILYKYGFDEQNGNFQNNNFGKGGSEADPVQAIAQDASGTDNANFVTPPDGESGVMRMFIFTGKTNGIDGALDNMVVTHELMHGVSGRLTGGAQNANCLTDLESGGMGEGWSDFLAVVLTRTEKSKRSDSVAIGTYASNSPQGVRSFPYSTDLKVNPHRFQDLNDPANSEVHLIGEIWNSMLYECYWNMVDKLGFTAKIADVGSGSGNTEFLKLVMDGLSLQPCNPTFLQARDAILQADELRNGGANKCEIIKGFAKRGLGIGASDQGTFVDSDQLLPGC